MQKLHHDLRARSRLSAQSVIILDEAGAVGLEDMASLFELAKKKDCRVILVGDTGQHSSVTRGDALRILEQYSDYRFEELTTIRRQKPETFRQIVELAAAKQTDKAFAKLLELGAVTEVLADGHQTDNGQLYQRAADAYLSATKQGRSALLVSPTWAEIEAVTEKVRDTLKTEGVISRDEETLRVFDSLSWTEAQKKNASQFEPGQRLRFVRKTRKFDRGDTVEVVATVDQPGAGPNTLRVRRGNGEEVLFPVGQGSALFDVGQARELKVAPGDWLLLQANHGKEFVNGERVQVREIRDGRIALTDGRVLPSTFNTFTHGYAITSHSSQGKTVDDVLLVASSRSFAAVNREQFYVSISRGRERCQVFTDDAELLARRVMDSHERKAAIELQVLRDGLAKLGFIRQEPLKEKSITPASAGNGDFLAVRQRRPMRQTRLSPMQRLSTLVENVRRWIEQSLGVEPKEAVEQTESVKPTRTVREALQQRHTHRQQQRRSGGMHV